MEATTGQRLVACAACGNEVSAQAVVCPRCGHLGPGRRTEEGLATWGQRALAFLVDAGVIAALLGTGFFLAFGNPMSVQMTNGQPAIGPGFPIFLRLLGFAVLVFGAVYKPVSESRGGSTIGKRSVKIRVVTAEGRNPIGAGLAWARWAVALATAIVPVVWFVDHLWPLWDERRQALHDKAAGTLVVHA